MRGMSRFEGTTRPRAARGSRHVRPARRHGRGGGGSRWAGGSEAKSKWSSTRSAPPRPALLRITGAELWPRLGSLTPCVFMWSRRGACFFCAGDVHCPCPRTASARNSKRGGGGVGGLGRREEGREGEGGGGVCVCVEISWSAVHWFVYCASVEPSADSYWQQPNIVVVRVRHRNVQLDPKFFRVQRCCRT